MFRGNKRKSINRIQVLTLIVGLSTVIIVIFLLIITTNPSFFEQSKSQYEIDIYFEINDSLHVIDLGAFEITTPKRYKYVREQGIDSFVGIITDFKDTIYFDYGWYSNDLMNDESSISYDTISGFKVITSISPNGVGVHFPQIKEDDKLTLHSSTLDQILALEIYRSIKIPTQEGYTSKQLGSNISLVDNQGRKLFQSNCIQCHRHDGVRIGPALNQKTIIRSGEKWFIDWVVNPDELIKNNKQAKELFELYNETTHPAFPFGDEDLEKLVLYVKEQE